MSFTAQKATDLSTSNDSLDSLIATNDAYIASFESMLNSNVPNKCFKYVVEQGEPDGDSYCEYKEIAWFNFCGPFPSGSGAGWHFVFRTFKSKVAEYADQTTYLDLVEEKVSAACIEKKEQAVSNFDDFLDAFKADIDSKLS